MILFRFNSLNKLLIEPFGIETHQGRQGAEAKGSLLIEPFGIETRQRGLHGVHAVGLLIEPFGIETSGGDGQIGSNSPFNRTFWN